MTWSESLSSIVSNSILPWVDCTIALRSLTRGTTAPSWVRNVRRSAFGHHDLVVGDREPHRHAGALRDHVTLARDVTDARHDVVDEPGNGDRHRDAGSFASWCMMAISVVNS